MTYSDGSMHWAPKVPQWQIRRLYETDARGIVDDELIDKVGWALWERCDSILAVTAAHYGSVRCPTCTTVFERRDQGADEELISCPRCGWSMAWAAYHRSYRGKQLFGANAVAVFKRYHVAFLLAQTARTKMLLIDRLIHAFHVSVKEVGRPVAANLIEGSLKQVIQFLDALSSGGSSATGVGDSREAWRRTLAGAAWSAPFRQEPGDS